MPLGTNRLVGGVQMRFLLDTPANRTRFESGREAPNTLVILYGKDTCQYETRWHIDGKKPGGFSCIEEVGLTADAVKLIVESCIEGLADSVAANAAAIAALPPNTDTIPTGIAPGPADGQFTLTMSDGSTLPGTVQLPADVTITPGTITASATGVTAWTLTDGTAIQFDYAALVSPNDVDIASFAVVTNPDGSSTVTPTLGDGGTLPAFSTGPDTFLQQPTLGADGCTVSFPLSTGALYTLDLCDLLSEVTDNGDGTFTHEPSGVSWREGSPSVVAVTNSAGNALLTPTVDAAGNISYELANVASGFRSQQNPTAPDAWVTAQEIKDWFTPSQEILTVPGAIPLAPNTSLNYMQWVAPSEGTYVVHYYLGYFTDVNSRDALGGHEIMVRMLSSGLNSFQGNHTHTGGQMKEGSNTQNRLNGSMCVPNVDPGDTVTVQITSSANSVPATIGAGYMVIVKVNPFSIA